MRFQATDGKGTKFKSINLSQSSHTSDFFFSKGKRKGKGVRPGKARRCSVTEVDGSRPLFLVNPFNAGLFSRDFEW